MNAGDFSRDLAEAMEIAGHGAPVVVIVTVEGKDHRCVVDNLGASRGSVEVATTLFLDPDE